LSTRKDRPRFRPRAVRNGLGVDNIFTKDGNVWQWDGERGDWAWDKSATKAARTNNSARNLAIADGIGTFVDLASLALPGGCYRPRRMMA
jgi:hypothetical protein